MKQRKDLGALWYKIEFHLLAEFTEPCFKKELYSRIPMYSRVAFEFTKNKG